MKTLNLSYSIVVFHFTKAAILQVSIKEGKEKMKYVKSHKAKKTAQHRVLVRATLSLSNIEFILRVASYHQLYNESKILKKTSKVQFL